MSSINTWYVLKRVGTERYFQHKKQAWDAYPDKAHLAKWFGTQEAAEAMRLRRGEPDRWEITPIETIIGNDDRVEKLETVIRHWFPDVGAVGAKMIASEVLLFKQ